MIIELWGVRGSLPTPLSNAEYRNKIHDILKLSSGKTFPDQGAIDAFIDSLPLELANVFGGNTTCVSVTSASGELFILDCGTGIRALGDRLIKEDHYRGKALMNFFITHSHWDHIQGFPFFKPAWVSGNRIVFHAPFPDLESRFNYQHDFRFFPRTLDEMGAAKEFRRIAPGEVIETGGVQIDCIPLQHPGGSFAYRFREGGKTFIFATDSEFNGEYLEKLSTDHSHFFNNADLLIIDSQYSLDDSFMKFDWGHTSYTMAVNCGVRWNIGDLVLTHHEPSYSDAIIANHFAETIEHRNIMSATRPALHIATEGMKFVLE